MEEEAKEDTPRRVACDDDAMMIWGKSKEGGDTLVVEEDPPMYDVR